MMPYFSISSLLFKISSSVVDDQSQERIARETETFASIVGSDFIFVGSDVIDDEISQIEKLDLRLDVKRFDVKRFTDICRVYVSLTDEIVD